MYGRMLLKVTTSRVKVGGKFQVESGKTSEFVVFTPIICCKKSYSK